MESVHAALTSPRRIATAVALAVLMAGSSVGLIGYANAADEAPPFWSIPASNVGDKAQYTLQAAPNGFQSSQRTLSWLEPQVVRATNGTAYDAAHLHRAEHRVDPEGESSTWEANYYVALDGHEPLRRDQEIGHGRGSSSLGFGDVRIGNENTHATSIINFTNTLSAPCGFAPPFQFELTRLDQPMNLPGCGESPFAYAVVQVGSDERVLLVSGDGTKRIYYAPNLPVPERMVFNAHNFTYDWLLSGFQRGETEYPPPAAPVEQPRPAPTLRPTTRWGPDASDYAMDYSLRAAFDDAIASDDETAPQLQEFVARNPDWRMFSAGYSDVTDEAGRTWGWTMTLAGSGETIGVLSYQYQGTAPGPEPLFSAPEQRHLMNAFEPREHDEIPAMPLQLPTAGSAAAIWADEADEPLTNATGWHFTSGCLQYCFHSGAYLGSGDGVRPSYIVAGSGSVIDAIPLPEEQSGAGNVLYVDAMGGLIGGHMTHWTAKQGPQGMSLQSEGKSEPIGLAPQPGGWVPPAASITAAASALGLVLAGVYYIWPAIKGSAIFGLRTRRGGQQVLDHPVRRSLYDHIVEEPGIHYQALVRKTERGHGAVDHHLNRLATSALVTKVASQGYTCYFPKGERAVVDMGAAPALRATGAKSIFAAIQQTPGTSVAQLAADTGLSPGTVSHHLRRMREAQIVESVRDGKMVRLYAVVHAAPSS